MPEPTTQTDVTNSRAAVVAAINHDLRADFAPPGLYGADAALETLFPDSASRPCLRTWRSWQRLRLIPVVKIGRRTFFNVSDCQRAIAKQFTIKARV